MLTIFLIKYQLTTCFLLLLGLQFQKLGCFQERFDAHFCPVGKTAVEFLKRKGDKAKCNTRLSTTGRGSQSKAGKKGNRIPPQQKLYHLRRRVTNKMALKVVGTNKVCESRTICNRPQTDSLPPSHTRDGHKTRTEMETGLPRRYVAL